MLFILDCSLATEIPSSLYYGTVQPFLKVYWTWLVYMHFHFSFYDVLENIFYLVHSKINEYVWDASTAANNSMCLTTLMTVTTWMYLINCMQEGDMFSLIHKTSMSTFMSA